MSYYGRLNTGTQVGASISPATETDTYRTNFIAGLTYQITAKGASTGNGSLVDPHMSLTTIGGSQLGYNDDISSTNQNAEIVFTAKTSSDYLVNVAENGGNATGSYTLVISAGFASNYSDKVIGTANSEGIAGLDGNDTLSGSGGNDWLYGQNGNDSLLGGNDNDNLQGGSGNDVLRGQEGNDVLVSGTGADVLIGGNGADRFEFSSAGDSTPAAFDRIIAGDGTAAFNGIGVGSGDVLDLSRIDANPYQSGNQAFHFAGGTLTTGVAQLYEDAEGNTVFVASTDSDSAAEVMIKIADGSVRASQYTAGEFLL